MIALSRLPTASENAPTAALVLEIAAESGDVLSGGNFHGAPLALAFDTAAIALTTLAGIAERRIDRLVNPDLNQGLPACYRIAPKILVWAAGQSAPTPEDRAALDLVALRWQVGDLLTFDLATPDQLAMNFNGDYEPGQLGQLLRDERIAQNLTQKGLLQQAGLTPSFVSKLRRIEHGQLPLPKDRAAISALGSHAMPQLPSL